jgi:hypothetical protein
MGERAALLVHGHQRMHGAAKTDREDFMIAALPDGGFNGVPYGPKDYFGVLLAPTRFRIDKRIGDILAGQDSAFEIKGDGLCIGGADIHA